MHKNDADRRCYFFMKSASLNPFFEVINYEQHRGKKVDSIIVKDRHFTDQDVVTVLTPKQLLENMGIRTIDSDL